MNKIIYLALIFLLTVFITPLVFAQEMDYKDHVVLPKNSIVNAPYFAGGQNITVNGTVKGDAYVAGGEILMDGTVDGDLLVAGGNVVIRGTVTHNVRAVGGNITVSGVIGGNLSVGGGNVTITDSANIKGDVVAGSGTLKVFGPVGKNVIVGGGSVTLDQKIGGNAVIGASTLNIGSSAAVAGNLTYYSSQTADIQQGAIIAGQTTYHQVVQQHRQTPVKTTAANIGGIWIIMKMISFLSSLVIGLLLISLAPVFSIQVTNVLQKNLWASMGIGLLILIVTPIAIVILMFTVIGLPLAFIGLFYFMLVIYLSKIFISLWIGMKILGYWYKKPHVAWSFVLGLFLWIVVTSIPIIGWLLGFLALIAGLGALFMQKKATFLSLKAKKLI